MKKEIKISLQAPQDLPSHWIWSRQQSGDLGLQRLTDTQNATFLNAIVDQVIKGPPSIGKWVIHNNIQFYRGKGERDFLSIKGTDGEKERKGLHTVHRLFKLAKREHLCIISEEVEQTNNTNNLSTL